MNIVKIFMVLWGLSSAYAASAQQIFPNYVVGTLSEMTSTTDGLLIRFPNAKPTLCTDPYGWLLIPNASQTMIAVTLSNWMVGQRSFTVYIDPAWPGPHCGVVQVDPVN